MNKEQKQRLLALQEKLYGDGLNENEVAEYRTLEEARAKEAVDGEETLHRNLSDIVVRSIDEKAGTVEFIASTGAIDRYQEIVDPEGWELKNFGKNGPILANHTNEVQSIIGRGVKAWVENGKLIVKVKFAIDVEENTLARYVFNMVKAGYIRAVSVGFLPTEWEFVDKTIKGKKRSILVWKKSELLELSVVAVPANPEALVKAFRKGELQSKDIDTLRKELEPLEVEQLDEGLEQSKLLKLLADNHESVKSYRKGLEKLRKILGVDPSTDELETIDKTLKAVYLALGVEGEDNLGGDEPPENNTSNNVGVVSLATPSEQIKPVGRTLTSEEETAIVSKALEALTS